MSEKKIRTGVAVILRPEGIMLNYSYSTLDDVTNIVTSTDNSGNFIVTDAKQLAIIKQLNDIVDNILNPLIQTGSITIQYMDNDTNTLIEPATVENNKTLATYVYQSKDFSGSGYKLKDNSQSSQTVTLTTTNTNAIITFTYTKKTSVS